MRAIKRKLLKCYLRRHCREAVRVHSGWVELIHSHYMPCSGSIPQFKHCVLWLASHRYQLTRYQHMLAILSK